MHYKREYANRKAVRGVRELVKKSPRFQAVVGVDEFGIVKRF